MSPEDAQGQGERAGGVGIPVPGSSEVVRLGSCGPQTGGWGPARRLRRPARRGSPAAPDPDATAPRLEALHRQASALAHDFNNLLGVIVGANEALSAELEPGSERQQLAQVSLRAAEQGAELLRRLLDLAEDQPAAPARADCVEAAEAAARFARHAVPATRVTVRPANERPACAAEATALESALLNLCINAGDAGAGTVAIEMHGIFLSRGPAAALQVEPGPYARIAVSDDGAGMSAEILGHATQPFFTTKAGEGGTGLGLSSVSDFARRCGGRLLLQSEEGVGTTAALYLPRVLCD